MNQSIKNNSLKEFDSLIMELRNLNKKRNVLVNGITGGRNGLYVIHHRGKNAELTLDFFTGSYKRC